MPKWLANAKEEEIEAFIQSILGRKEE